MSSKCAKCNKTVYPAEELKCLDKVWHKGCFKCTTCGMSLNMKNYKGYDKLPYCNAHYPQTKATVIADTLEQKRLTQISNMQSQVAYHADFEKNIKGTLTAIPDDLELKRVKDITGFVSQSSYIKQHSTDMNIPYTNEAHKQPNGNRTSYMPYNVNVPPQIKLPSPLTTDYTSPPSPPNVVQSRGGNVYTALYDYDAQDSDEVSFVENDRIIESEVIDSGWIIGIIERTQQKGMIPANYIQLI